MELNRIDQAYPINGYMEQGMWGKHRYRSELCGEICGSKNDRWQLMMLMLDGQVSGDYTQSWQLWRIN